MNGDPETSTVEGYRRALLSSRPSFVRDEEHVATDVVATGELSGGEAALDVGSQPGMGYE